MADARKISLTYTRYNLTILTYFSRKIKSKNKIEIKVRKLIRINVEVQWTEDVSQAIKFFIEN